MNKDDYISSEEIAALIERAEARSLKEGDEQIITAVIRKTLLIEKLVKEYDIRVGFHNHPRRPDNPNYRVWDPQYILSILKDRDSRLGSCAGSLGLVHKLSSSGQSAGRPAAIIVRGPAPSPMTEPSVTTNSE
jgi:hypothetical protein